MAKDYETFPHTADLGLIARGATLGRLFENAALGLTSLLTDPEKVRPERETLFELRADTPESLLVAWLNEVLYRFTVRRDACRRFEVRLGPEGSLSASAWGEPLDPACHPVLREIKSATYSDLRIVREKHGFSVRIVFDI